MEVAALIVILVAGVWLLGVAILMALQPRRFLHLLALTASNWRVNVVELVPRMIAGMALVVRSEESKLPAAFQIGGWLIVVSSILLLLMPLRWHAGYAIWWSRNLPLWSVQALAPVSAAFGASLIYAAL